MRVVAAWEPPDREVLVVRAGDTVAVGRRDSEWPEFLWCENEHGVGAWVPQQYLESFDVPTTRLTDDYSATELAVEPGDLVEATRSAGGRRWCIHRDGTEGWLPEKVLTAGD
jgi:hypothetical protein